MEYNNTPSTSSLEQLLHDTMTVTPSAVSTQNQNILLKIQEVNVQSATLSNQTTNATIKKSSTIFSSLWRHLRILAPAPVICLILVITCTVTVHAAVRFLSADRVAEKMNFDILEKAFQSKDALYIGETQTSGDFDITLIGITFGNAVRDILGKNANIVETDQAYAVVALSRTDGADLPDVRTVDGPIEESLLPVLDITFLAKGYSPINNPLDRNLGGTQIYHDGIYYYLIQCHGLSDFAESGIYVAANTLGSSAFQYDETSGSISLGRQVDTVQALFELSLSESLLTRITPDEATAILDSSDTSSMQSASTLSYHTVFGDFPFVQNETTYWTEDQLALLNSLSLKGTVRHITSDRILTIEREQDASKKTIIATVRIYDLDGSLLHEKNLGIENQWPLAAWHTYTNTGFVLAQNNRYQIYDYDFHPIGIVDPATIPTSYPFETASATTIDTTGKSLNSGYTFPNALSCSFSANLRYFLITISVKPTEHSQLKETWLYDIHQATWSRVIHDQPHIEGFYSFNIYKMVPSNDGKYAAFKGFYLKERIPGMPQNSTPCYGLYSLENQEVMMYRDGDVDKIQSMGNHFCMMVSYENTSRLARWYSILDPSTSIEYRTEELISSRFETTVISPDGRYIIFHAAVPSSDPSERHTKCRIFCTDTETFSQTFLLPIHMQIIMGNSGYVATPNSTPSEDNHLFGGYQ